METKEHNRPAVTTSVSEMTLDRVRVMAKKGLRWNWRRGAYMVVRIFVARQRHKQLLRLLLGWCDSCVSLIVSNPTGWSDFG
jgi:hypothetical protein